MFNKNLSVVLIAFIINCVCAVEQIPGQQQPHTLQHAAPIEILSKSDTTSPDGSFNSSYESSDGTKVENHGFYKRIQVPQSEDINGKVVDAHEENVFVQSGAYSYVDPDGNVIQLQYIADENGFQPTGDHLPKAGEQRFEQQRQELHQDRPIEDRRPGFEQQRQELHQDRPIEDRRPGFRQNENQNEFVQNRPIQNYGSRRTRQSYYSVEPGYGVVENRPINDYRYPYSVNPLRRARQYLYQDRPIQQGYYPLNGGLSTVVESRPSYNSGYYPNGGLSSTIVSRPSYRSGYYTDGETLHTSPSTYPNYYPNNGISSTIESKSSNQINCIPNQGSNSNGGISETVVSNPSYQPGYYPNKGISETVITRPSNQPCYYPNSGLSETVVTKPSNPCYYLIGRISGQPCYYPNGGGLSSNIEVQPSTQNGYYPNSGLSETVVSQPSNQQGQYPNEGFSTNVETKETISNGGLVSGQTKSPYTENLSQFQRLGSIGDVPTTAAVNFTNNATDIKSSTLHPSSS